MKKILCACIYLLAPVLNCWAGDAVKINVNGNILAAPCELNGGQGSLSVDLGDIKASTLQTPGSFSDWVGFSITLDKCPAGTTKATIHFSGTADSVHPIDMYVNTGTAKNVAIQLQGAGGEGFGNGESYTYNVHEGTNWSYSLRTRAYSDKGGAVPGTIVAAVTATMTYQ